MAFKVLHNLDQLTAEELRQYLREVSTFVGLDPDMEALDTIWMQNETGPGRSLVVYARRGTAEILRNIYEVEVERQTFQMLNGSIVYTTEGISKKLKGRKEVAIGSKFIGNATGQELDNAIMTGSTRSLRRLTMQFTTLGILDESEVVARLGEQPNPAGSVRLAADPTPAMYAAPTVPQNNEQGKPVCACDDPSIPSGAHFEGCPQYVPLEADKEADTPAVEMLLTPVPTPVTEDVKAAKKAAKRGPKAKGVQLDLDVVPETVSAQAVAAVPTQADSVPPQVNSVVPTQVNPVPTDLPSREQMAVYRQKIGVFTSQLPASAGMDATTKMRAFIAYMNSGTAPSALTVTQWDKQVAWFEDFAARNNIKGLIKFINDTLGVA